MQVKPGGGGGGDDDDRDDDGQHFREIRFLSFSFGVGKKLAILRPFSKQSSRRHGTFISERFDPKERAGAIVYPIGALLGRTGAVLLFCCFFGKGVTTA